MATRFVVWKVPGTSKGTFLVATEKSACRWSKKELGEREGGRHRSLTGEPRGDGGRREMVAGGGRVFGAGTDEKVQACCRPGKRASGGRLAGRGRGAGQLMGPVLPPHTECLLDIACTLSGMYWDKKPKCQQSRM